MSLAAQRSFAKLLDEAEELLGLRSSRVICYRDDQPEPLSGPDDFVIITQALAPDAPQESPPHREDQRIISPTAREAPVKFAPPPPEPLPVRPMFSEPLPVPEKPRDLLSVALSAGLFAQLDGPGGGDLWLIRDGRSLIYCGSERMCRKFLEERSRRPVHRQTPLGSR